MAYNSILFLIIFLPAALIVYQIVPQKLRLITLIIFSYIFYWLNSQILIFYLLSSTLVTHFWARWMEKFKPEQKDLTEDQKKHLKKCKKAVYLSGIFILIGMLGYLKYRNFFFQNMQSIFRLFSVTFRYSPGILILPMGISFYTLQAVGYLTDVYWEKIPADTKISRTMLFLCFFPQIMEGPICRYSDTADTLYEGKSLQVNNIREGSLRIVWGLFKKMVAADRLAIFVAAVFDSGVEYHGMTVALAAVAYATQLYLEFSGVMDIVLGCGKMFGIGLPENFRQPFFSRSASEFWRRWHITLGAWLKNYVFYPVSLSGAVKKWNRFGRKHCGKYITKLGTTAFALFPVWLCNGLWHGPEWNYIFYGMYYFVIIFLEIALEPAAKKFTGFLHIRRESVGYHIFQTLKLLPVIFTGELFFRANGLRSGIHMFRSIFRDFHFHTLWDGSLLRMGLDQMDYLAVIYVCLVVFITSLMKENGISPGQAVAKRKLPVRWAVCYILIFSVIILGAYGVGYQKVDLIYAGF